MIYARVDVNFGDHPKALEAGPVARDLWTWGLLYCRKHELDGVLPVSAVVSSTWGAGGNANRKVADRLVSVGLWKACEGGWRILHYAEKNETRREIDERRAASRERQQRFAKRRRERVNNALGPNEHDALQICQIQEPEPYTRTIKGEIAREGAPPDLDSGFVIPSVNTVDVFVTPDVAQAFAKGVSEATGTECTIPEGKPARDLIAACAKHSRMSGAELVDWTRSKALEWAKTGPPAVNPWKFKDWLDGGGKARVALVRPNGRTVQPLAKDWKDEDGERPWEGTR